MEFIIIKAGEEETVSSFQMRVLYELLNTTVAIFAQDVKKELQTSGKYVGNADFIENQGENVVIENLYDDSWSVTLPASKFMNFLDKWDKLLKLTGWPKKAIITMDDDYNFTFEYVLNGEKKVI